MQGALGKYHLLCPAGVPPKCQVPLNPGIKENSTVISEKDRLGRYLSVRSRGKMTQVGGAELLW